LENNLENKVRELKLTIKDLEARLHGVVDMLLQCEAKLNQTRGERDFFHNELIEAERHIAELNGYDEDEQWYTLNDTAENDLDDQWDTDFSEGHPLDGVSNYCNAVRGKGII